MDHTQFDNLIRSLTESRRSLLGGTLLAAAAALGAGGGSAKQKRRRKKLHFNQFGCLNVGQKCYGKNAACCSGICTGSRGSSRCIAHHEAGCVVEQSSCSEPTLCGAQGQCYRTTGSAGFCGDYGQCDCAPCQQDSDCHTQFGSGAACIVCADCLGVNGSNGTACVPPAA